MSNVSTTGPPNVVGLRLTALVRLARPGQWVKNGFVLAPLVFAGKFTDRTAVLEAIVAFALFCLAASITYVINDIQDVDRDRLHPKKSKTRPLAAGTVSLAQARYLLAALVAILAIGLALFPPVALVIVGYLALTLSYTFWLKHQPVIDLFAVATGFVLRVYAGAAAIDVPLSSWMFITTLCLALYLASIKRRQELLRSGETTRAVLRHYTPALVDRFAEMSATGALVFYSLFVVSTHPELVYSIPIVLFGLFRYWYVVEALEGGESPTEALLKDWQLGATIVAWCGACAWALWPK